MRKLRWYHHLLITGAAITLAHMTFDLMPKYILKKELEPCEVTVRGNLFTGKGVEFSEPCRIISSGNIKWLESPKKSGLRAYREDDKLSVWPTGELSSCVYFCPTHLELGTDPDGDGKYSVKRKSSPFKSSEPITFRSPENSDRCYVGAVRHWEQTKLFQASSRCRDIINTRPPKKRRRNQPVYRGRFW